MDLRVTMRRYGPTVHLILLGELDVETRAALDEVQAVPNNVDVVACDMRRLTFMDVVGLHGPTTFARRLNGREIAFFAYDWQPQPLRLMDLVDCLYPKGDRGGPTGLLRRDLRGSAASARAAGATRARKNAPPPAAIRPVRGGAVILR
ncbi:hypothetical protein [Streptomyces sp. H27-H5]|uniref:hypothetical protein n=1 Tax=Streptomyces sp. H27-H5 TaxID=2996460 RepID=UPI00227087DA|nr:hypothetical protein [Streptomyces sp. H27-H5]MCY0962909.1 hypothetical protein [Streptomyces sp. H27-H5]